MDQHGQVEKHNDLQINNKKVDVLKIRDHCDTDDVARNNLS